MRAIFQRRYLFHLLYVLVYIGFLFLDKQWYSKHNDWESFWPTFLIHLALMAMLVYTNTLILIPQFFLKKKFLLYITGVLLIISIYTFLKCIYTEYMFDVLFDVKDDSPLTYFWGSFVYAVWFTIVSSMLFITQKWYDQNQQVKNIQISQLQTELKYLRLQVNPHFLFNGLNTIYGTIDQRNQQARDILVQFSDLLRYNLYEADVDMVDIDKEVNYLENYVALQKARSDKDLQIELEISIENHNIKIAPLLFIPFVENAFKFISRDESKENKIIISLQQRTNHIIFRCSNTHEALEEKTGGIGLSNVKRRLELLYKDRYTIDIKKGQDFYSVQLIITV